MNVDVLGDISECDAAQWNQLCGRDYPFLRHEFLLAAETTGCVSPESGWTPHHLLMRKNGTLRGAMLLYEKTHSWGEFVFDWAWAHAYERVGLEYYPKLVSAAPFTPAQSPRLLTADPDDRETQEQLAVAARTLAAELGHSSLHVQFPLQRELSALRAAGLKTRQDCQFHWSNRGYRSFDDFLATFTSSKRKKVRRDRRHVSEQGIRFKWFDGHTLTPELWTDVHALISTTFLRRGSLPYFSRDFFCELSAQLPDNIAVVIGESDNKPTSAAVFFRGANTLYGRYWGCNAFHNALHFETCYYQGIEYCIEHGIAVFEPGTQGEHKISRGFSPVSTWSAHWLAREEFFAAIGDYLDDEKEHIDRYIDAVREHTPYRVDSQADRGKRGKP